MEDGAAFCPNCRAPQIRVPGAEDRPATAPLAPGTPGEIQPPATPVAWQERHPAEYSAWQGQSGVAAPNDRVSWGDALPGAVVAGLLIGAVLIPILSVFIAPAVAGTVAVVLYAQRRPDQSLTRGVGARIGSIAGLFGFVLFAVLVIFESLVIRGGAQFREALQQAAARNPTPEVQAMMSRLLTPEGIVVIAVIMLIFFFALFAGFGAIGGAIGVKLTQRRDRGRQNW